MAAQVATRLWSMEEMAALIEEHSERNAPRLADRDGVIGIQADGCQCSLFVPN